MLNISENGTIRRLSKALREGKKGIRGSLKEENEKEIEALISRKS